MEHTINHYLRQIQSNDFTMRPEKGKGNTPVVSIGTNVYRRENISEQISLPKLKELVEELEEVE